MLKFLNDIYLEVDSKKIHLCFILELQRWDFVTANSTAMLWTLSSTHIKQVLEQMSSNINILNDNRILEHLSYLL